MWKNSNGIDSIGGDNSSSSSFISSSSSGGGSNSTKMKSVAILALIILEVSVVVIATKSKFEICIFCIQILSINSFIVIVFNRDP